MSVILLSLHGASFSKVRDQTYPKYWEAKKKMLTNNLNDPKSQS